MLLYNISKIPSFEKLPYYYFQFFSFQVHSVFELNRVKISDLMSDMELQKNFLNLFLDMMFGFQVLKKKETVKKNLPNWNQRYH